MLTLLTRRHLLALGGLAASAAPAGAVRFETLDRPTAELVVQRCADEAALHQRVLDALAAEQRPGEASATPPSAPCPLCGCRLVLGTPPLPPG
jgi:hypothetical protein